MWLDRLKEMKKQSKKTSKEISECTGIPKSTIDKLFAGQTKEPFLSSVRLIVHCLGYTLDDLDDETEYYNNPQITIQALIRATMINKSYYIITKVLITLEKISY